MIAKAMAKDPAQRFSLARELADAAAVLVHQPAGATTRPWQPVPAAAVSSYPDAHPGGPQWGHTAGGPPTQQGFAAAPTQWGAPALAPSPAPVTRRRHRRLILAAVAAVVVLAGAALGTIPWDTVPLSTPRPLSRRLLHDIHSPVAPGSTAGTQGGRRPAAGARTGRPDHGRLATGRASGGRDDD